MVVPKLWIAVLNEQYCMANQMIANGANVNGRKRTSFDSSTTLLHYAVVKQGDAECMHMLAALGADFNARDSENGTPLHWAAKIGAPSNVIEVLINKGAFVDARDDRQFTPLHYAARNNCIEVAQTLIAKGASIGAISSDGRSVLHEAVSNHNFEMVKMLMSHGVNIDAKDICGQTPLLCYFNKHRREEEEKTEIIQLLLDNGADVNAKNNEGIFPLFYAAQFNRLDCVHLLLKRGARINEATNTGETALHAASEQDMDVIIALLLKFEADLNACDQEGKTPFELLRKSPSSEGTFQIVIKEVVKREALGQSVCEGYKQMVQSCETYSRFDQECREEIKRMQSEKIDIEDSVISFFSIFTMDEEKLAVLVRNEKFVTAFDLSKASFRIYAGELTTKFEAAKKRANFFISLEVILSDMLGHMLPALIVRKIAVNVKYNEIIDN